MRTPAVVVVGSGAAGLMAAIHASEQVPTLLVSDGALGRSNTAMAQGGLQVPFDNPESHQSLINDMVASARIPIDLDRVQRFVAEILPTVHRLEEWGLEVDRDPDGDWVRRLAGGLSEPRIVSASDQIGPAVMAVLKRVVQAHGVEVLAHHRVVDVAPGSEGPMLAVEDRDAQRSEIEAGAVVVATGGPTFRTAERSGERSTNQPNQNHRLFDLLGEKGLELVDGEAYQYQPFGLVAVEGPFGRCVPESVVNFPVELLDRHGDSIGPIRQDRFALTRRIFEVISAGDGVVTERGPGVWLTLSAVDPDELATIFPKLRHTVERQGWVGKDVLVRPFLHYYLGGFAVGPDGETTVPGLWLAGEMVGGLHGRNRLMGNGITDSLVHGRLAGRAAAAATAA